MPPWIWMDGEKRQTKSPILTLTQTLTPLLRFSHDQASPTVTAEVHGGGGGGGD